MNIRFWLMDPLGEEEGDRLVGEPGVGCGLLLES